LMGAKQDSKIIFCGDDGNLASFMPRVRRLTYSYGFDNGNFYRIDNYRVKKDRLNFSIQNSHGIYEDISLNLVGKHNALNSTACFAVAKILGIDFNDYRTIISKFKTVNRRLQLKYDVRGIKVYDDYAHHPKEIAASLSGLKDLYPQSRIITIFQPHLYSRTRDFHKELAKELSAADGIFLLEIYPAREEPIKNVNAGMIYKELVKKNKNTFHIKDKNKVIADVRDYMREGDVIVFQGAGDVTHVCDEFTQRLSVQKK